MTFNRILWIASFIVLAGLAVAKWPLLAQEVPGGSPFGPGLGGHLAGLSSRDRQLFEVGKEDFSERVFEKS